MITSLYIGPPVMTKVMTNIIAASVDVRCRHPYSIYKCKQGMAIPSSLHNTTGIECNIIY